MDTASNDKNRATTDTARRLLVKSRDVLRQTRITGLGVAKLAPKWGKELREQIMDTGKAIERKRSKTQTAKASKKSHQATPAKAPETATEKVRAAVNHTVERLNTVNQQLRQFSTGLIDTVAQARNDFVNEAMELGNPVNETAAIEASGSSAPDSSQESKSALVRTVRKVRNFNRGAYQVLKEKVEQVVDQAQKQGKTADLELRRKLESKRQQRRLNREQLFARLGLVTHHDIEDLNKRLILLANEFGHQAKAEHKAILERRKQERRNLKAAIEYDLRVFSRRERDRRAA